MKRLILLLAMLVQGCTMYENARVNPEIREAREIQRENDMHWEKELKPIEDEFESNIRSIKIRDIVEGQRP